MSTTFRFTTKRIWGGSKFYSKSKPVTLRVLDLLPSLSLRYEGDEDDRSQLCCYKLKRYSPIISRCLP